MVRSRSRTSGFTLVEVLVVLAIIATMTAIIAPTIINSKKRAKMTTSISNLKQCTTALVLYSDEHGGTAGMPIYSVAIDTLKKSPSCDPSDYLRLSCESVSKMPLIGSYAYVRGVASNADAKGWQARLELESPNYLLASVFYGEKQVRPWGGSEKDPCLANGDCMLPSRLIRSLPDTSVKVRMLPKSVAYGSGTVSMPFTWDNVFDLK